MALCRPLAVCLWRQGFFPVFAQGLGQIPQALSPPPAAVVFGASLGVRPSFDASRGIRRFLEVPTIIVVSPAENKRWIRDLRNRSGVYFIESGKPGLLAAKLSALLERAGRGEAALCAGGLCLFPDERRALCDGKPLALTPLEFGLLCCLVKNQNRPVSCEQLMQAVWGRSDETLLHTLRAHITALRAKLGPYRTSIAAVRKTGYLFRWDGEYPRQTVPRAI